MKVICRVCICFFHPSCFWVVFICSVLVTEFKIFSLKTKLWEGRSYFSQGPSLPKVALWVLVVNSLLVKCSMSQFLQSCLLFQIQYASVSLPIFSVKFSMPQIFKLCWLFVKFSVPHFLQSCLLSVKFTIPRSFQSCSVLNSVCLISSSLAWCL
jgi:hypothetical protein